MHTQPHHRRPPAPVVAEHITAVNAYDTAAIVATFAEDALVKDAHRESWGPRPSPVGWPR